MNFSSVLCSIQRALLARITPNLRKVEVKIDERRIKLLFFYDRPLSDKEQELLQDIDTEFISDFPGPEYNTSYDVVISPYPQIIPDVGLSVYERYE